MEYKVNKLLLRQTKSSSQTNVYFADDELVLESNLGRLFMICEIFSREKKIRDLIETIFRNIEADYYSSPSPDPESSLETACQNFNANLPDLLDKPINWLSKFNLLAGTLKDDEIFLASFGNFKTILLRDNKLINIIPEQEEIKHKEQKIFSQLISGEIKPYDIFLFSNPTLFDYFSKEKIKKTITSLTPEQSVEYFKNLLLENINPVSFAAIVFKFSDQKTESTKEEQYLKDFYTTQQSMDNLQDTERKTTKVLTANLWPSVKKKFAKKDKKIEKQVTGPTLDKNSIKALSNKTDRLAPIKKLLFSIKYTFQQIKNLPQIIGYKLRNISTKSKRIASVFLIIILIFSLSLIFLNYNNQKKQQQQAFVDQVKKIEDKISAAEAALIYQDEEAAQNDLKMAKTYLVELPLEKQEWQQKRDELESKISLTLNKVFHIYQVETELITDLTKINAGNITGMANIKDILYILTSADSFYQVSPDEKAYTFIADNFKYQTIKKWDDDNLIFLRDDNRFITYNLANKTTSLKKLELNNQTITDWQVYADRIYLLDSEQKQIYKISQPLSESYKLQNWYRDEPEILNQATQIMVDGDIWLADSQGKIFRFFQGLDQEFEIKQLNKDLAADIKIYTQKNKDKIYVLDKQNSRLLVIRKSGVVEKQFINENLKTAKDFLVSSDENKVWFSQQGKIHQIDLTLN